MKITQIKKTQTAEDSMSAYTNSANYTFHLTHLPLCHVCFHVPGNDAVLICHIFCTNLTLFHSCVSLHFTHLQLCDTHQVWNVWWMMEWRTTASTNRLKCQALLHMSSCTCFYVNEEMKYYLYQCPCVSKNDQNIFYFKSFFDKKKLDEKIVEIYTH